MPISPLTADGDFAAKAAVKKMFEWMNVELVKNGLIAGAAVALLSAVIVVALSGTIFGEEKAADPDLTKAQVEQSWLIKWVGISIVFGVISAVVYGFVRSSLNWGSTEYLLLAIGLAVVLTVMEFLPMYPGRQYAPFWQTYAELNFAYAIGFGLLVPYLVKV